MIFERGLSQLRESNRILGFISASTRPIASNFSYPSTQSRNDCNATGRNGPNPLESLRKQNRSRTRTTTPCRKETRTAARCSIFAISSTGFSGGLPQILGFGLLAQDTVIAPAAVAFIFSPVLAGDHCSASGHVPPSSGYERGAVSTTSQSSSRTDLRAPDIINDALERAKLSTADDIQGGVRGALTIEGNHSSQRS